MSVDMITDAAIQDYPEFQRKKNIMYQLQVEAHVTFRGIKLTTPTWRLWNRKK